MQDCTRPRHIEWRGLILCYVFGAILFCIYAGLSGQDANWDLQNYHDYVATALLHRRSETDVAPGDIQSYLNPLPYIFPYLLRHHLPPLLAACILAAAQAMVFPLLWASSRFLTTWTDSLIVRAMMVLVGGTSAITLSEVGTSFSDVQLAAFGLAALLSMLAAGEATSTGKARGVAMRFQLLARAWAGVAAGLKLTNGLFVVAALGATLVSGRRWHLRGRACACVLTGAAIGGLASGGWWAAYLFVQFGSPTFPYFNSIFRAPSAAFETFSDPAYVPKSLGDALSYPLQIAQGLHPTAENPFRDARLLVALIMCLAFIVLLARKAMVARSSLRDPSPAHHSAILQTSAFFVTGFLVWLFAFGIQRYAVVFEMVAGLLIPAIASILLPAPTALAGAAIASVALMAWTVPADWWHRPWADAYTAQLPKAVSAQAATFLWLKPPFGYWRASLPPGSKAFMMQEDLLQPGGILQRRFDDGMRLPPNGLIWNLAYDVPIEDQQRRVMAVHDLTLAPPCYRAPSLWWIPTIFCRVERIGSRRLAASDLMVGPEVSFSQTGYGTIYELSGWAPAEAGGLWSLGSVSSLVLRPQNLPQPLALDFGVAGLVGPSWPSSEVDVSADAISAPTRWLFEADHPDAVARTICVPPVALRLDGVVKLRFQVVSPHTPEQAGLGKDLGLRLPRSRGRFVDLGRVPGRGVGGGHRGEPG